METNNFTPPIDFRVMDERVMDMEDRVEDLGKKLLTEISEENLKYFSSEVKKITESILEKYIFDVYDLYTCGSLRISDMDKELSFTDTDSGYQQQMLNWKKQNAIIVKEQEITIPEFPRKTVTKSRHKESIVIGSAIATGLVIAGHPWIALVIELLSLSLAYKQYKDFAKSEKRYAMELERHKLELDRKKSEFIDGVKTDLKDWLTKGKDKSIEILNAFNLL